MIRRAIALDKSSPLVQFVTSVVELSAKEHEKSILAIEKALALDPNYSDACARLTEALKYAGRPEAGLEHCPEHARFCLPLR